MTEPPSAESVANSSGLPDRIMYDPRCRGLIDTDRRLVLDNVSPQFGVELARRWNEYTALRESAREARAAAIEECAKVCDRATDPEVAALLAGIFGENPMHWSDETIKWRGQMAESLAHEIRALGPAAAKAEEKGGDV